MLKILVSEPDQIRKSEDEAGPRRATLGGPLDEGKIGERDELIRGVRERAHVEEVAGEVTPSRCQLCTRRDVRGPEVTEYPTELTGGT